MKRYGLKVDTSVLAREPSGRKQRPTKGVYGAPKVGYECRVGRCWSCTKKNCTCTKCNHVSTS
jgi:hypothetical protein